MAGSCLSLLGLWTFRSKADVWVVYQVGRHLSQERVHVDGRRKENRYLRQSCLRMSVGRAVVCSRRLDGQVTDMEAFGACLNVVEFRGDENIRV